MLYKHEYKILKKIKINPVSSIVEPGFGKQKFIDMMEKGLIAKEHHYMDKFGRILYKYLITKKGFAQLNEFEENLIDSDPNNLNLDLKEVIDYLLGSKDFKTNRVNKYDVFKLFSKKLITIHEVDDNALGRTFRFDLTESGKKAYEKMLERL